VVLPQALRVIVPPLTNQYLNLTKNSSLAVAIGYPDIVSIANTALNQTGQAVECIAIIMLVYLSTSLLTAGADELVQPPRRAGGTLRWTNRRSPRARPPMKRGGLGPWLRNNLFDSMAQRARHRRWPRCWLAGRQHVRWGIATPSSRPIRTPARPRAAWAPAGA
jgi:hypothetical protein